MLIAGSVRLADFLQELSTVRPIFHSEADFQIAFGWHLQTFDPTLRVRLETRPAPGVRLDVQVSNQDQTADSAIELKYLTRLWSGRHDDEQYDLKNQGAQDIRAYDVVHDIHRVETFVGNRACGNGAVVCISNDPSYWTAPGHLRETNAAAFRLHDSVVLEGTRAWGPRAGEGTTRGRETALEIRGRYEMRWLPYSALDGPFGTFRVLVIEVQPIG